MKKARISSYTRKDGVFVAEHHDKRPAARPDAPAAAKPAAAASPLGLHKVGDKVSTQGGKSGVVVGDRDGKVLVRHAGGYTETYKHGDLRAGPKPSEPIGVSDYLKGEMVSFQHDGAKRQGKITKSPGKGMVRVEFANGVFVDKKESEIQRIGDRPDVAAGANNPAGGVSAPAVGGGAPTAQKPADAAAKDVRDDENPKFALQSLGSEHVAAAASGKHDLNKQAKIELANRGLDAHGRWIGFNGAEAVHGLSLSDMQAGRVSDENQVAGHFQTLHPKVLSAVASGKFDMNAHAKREAASRGIDQNGKWVGFDKAKAIHAEKPEAPIAKAIPLAFRLP